jgi:hypothetical protein
MATLNIDRVQTRRLFGLRLVTGTISMSNSYTTGGEAINLPLTEVKGMVIENKGGYMFEYDRANKKVKAYQFDYAAASAGPAVEVPAATNLSALTGIAFLAWGW